MNRKIVINKGELILPILTFTDKMSAYSTEQQRAMHLDVGIDLQSADFPYALPSDIFLNTESYFLKNGITSIEIFTNEDKVYETNRYDHIEEINFQFDGNNENIANCFLSFNIQIDE